MSEQLGAISVFLAKESSTFDNLVDKDKVPTNERKRQSNHTLQGATLT